MADSSYEDVKIARGRELDNQNGTHQKILVLAIMHRPSATSRLAQDAQCAKQV